MGISPDDVVFLRGSWNLRSHHMSDGLPYFQWRLIDMPPGVEIAATRQPGSLQPGQSVIFIKAGLVDQVAFVIQTHPGITFPDGIMAGNTRPWTAGALNGASYVFAADKVVVDLAALATPPMAVAIGEPIIILVHQPFFSKRTDLVNSSATDEFLKDIDIHGMITLAYGRPGDVLP
jgi:hypothetical protein